MRWLFFLGVVAFKKNKYFKFTEVQLFRNTVIPECSFSKCCSVGAMCGANLLV